MPITSIKRDFGVAPSGVRITSTDSLSTVQSAGYMTSQASFIRAINGGPFGFVSGDVVMMAASDGDQIFSFSGNDFSTLVPQSGGGSVTASQVQQNSFNSGVDSGVADAYVVTLNPSALLNPVNGTIVSFSPLNNNLTTTPTVAVNGDTAFTIVLPNGSPVQAGDISTANLCYLIFDQANAYYYLLTPAVSGGGSVTPAQVQGWNFSYAYATPLTTNNYTASSGAAIPISPPLNISPSSGTVFSIAFQFGNTGPVTLIIGTFGVPWPVKYNGNDLVSGDIVGTQTYLLQWDSLNSIFEMLNPSVSSVPPAPDTFTKEIAQLTAAIPSGFTVSSVPGTTIDFSLLVTSIDKFNGYFPSATSMTLTNYATAMSDFAINAPSLTTLSVPNLTTIGGQFISTSNSTTISLPSLTSVTGDFTLNGSAATTSVNFNSLLTIGGNAYFNWDGAIADLIFSSLTTITGGLVFVQTGVDSVLSLNTLTTISGVTGIDSASIDGTSSTMTSFLPAVLTTMNGGIKFYESFSSTAQMPALTTFTFSAGLLKVGGNCNMKGCALDLASVDGILASLAALDGTGGTTSYNGMTVDVSGGTSAAPDAAGLASIAILVGRGNTVNHN